MTTVTLDYLKKIFPFHTEWETKTIMDFYQEIRDGEATFDPVHHIRKVAVGYMQIQRPNGDWLMETSQVWQNGHVIYRNCPMAGKLRLGKIGNTPLIETLREVEEELGYSLHVLNNEVNVGAITFTESKIRKGEATAFPGVPCAWEDFHYHWNMPRMLEKPSYKEVDGKKTTYFGWVKDKPLVK